MRAVLRIRKEPAYRRLAFEQGLKRVGFVLDDKLARPAGPEDWLILWNRKKGEDEQAADRWEQLGGTVIVTENGYLAKVDKTYYAISVHGHNGSGWFPIGDEDRFSLLGFELLRLRENGTETVVRAQRGIGSTLMASPHGWAERTARQFPGARVVHHPGDKNKYAHDEAALAKAARVIIWSSALGVRALTKGIQVAYAAPHWVCSAGAVRLKDADTTMASTSYWYSQRAEAMHKMSHGQWHHEEIATGEPFARVIEKRAEAMW